MKPLLHTDKLSDGELALLKTVVYASVFDYPLTQEELTANLIGFRADSHTLLREYQQSQQLQEFVEFQGGFFFLKGQSDLLNCRAQREHYSLKILAAHRRILRLICLIPFTRLVALSGGVAHLNLRANDDVDLFIMTKGRFVWAVAVTTLLLTKVFRRRKTICFNYLVTDSALELRSPDLFSANQLINLKPLIGSRVAARLLEQNRFVRRYHPNFTSTGLPPFSCAPEGFQRKLKSVLETLLGWGPGQLYERICRSSYRSYLLRRKAAWATPEEVVLSSDVIKLHTRGHRRRVYERFDKLLKEVLAGDEQDASQ